MRKQADCKDMWVCHLVRYHRTLIPLGLLPLGAQLHAQLRAASELV